MYNHGDEDEMELEALRLIDKAEELIDQGNPDEAINLYEKAAQLYLDIGSYMKIEELFMRIVKIISQFKNHIQATYRLKSILRKTEELQLDEVNARLLVQLGNISSKINDWETAGESYWKASDLFYKTDPEEYYNLSSVLLMKAGQLFERSSTKKDTGKRLILQAVMQMHKFNERYEMEEKRATLLLISQEFEAAAEKFLEIAAFFEKALEGLDEILEEAEASEVTKLNAKARFAHFVAEYKTVAALCLQASGDTSLKHRRNTLASEALELFKESIMLLKKYILIKKRIQSDPEVILRICFDTMLLAIVQEIINDESFSPTEFLLDKINDRNDLVKELKNTPYFKITERIEKVGAQEALSMLKSIHLGHFEKIKNTLISYFLS
ncbi:MAG: hypothetical protein ACTSR8_22530 [Promethearchaeota archaeon]